MLHVVKKIYACLSVFFCKILRIYFEIQPALNVVWVWNKECFIDVVVVVFINHFIYCRLYFGSSDAISYRQQ